MYFSNILIKSKSNKQTNKKLTSFHSGDTARISKEKTLSDLFEIQLKFQSYLLWVEISFEDKCIWL